MVVFSLAFDVESSVGAGKGFSADSGAVSLLPLLYCAKMSFSSIVSSSASVMDFEAAGADAFSLFLSAAVFLGAGDGLAGRGTNGKSDSGTGLPMSMLSTTHCRPTLTEMNKRQLTFSFNKNCRDQR